MKTNMRAMAAGSGLALAVGLGVMTTASIHSPLALKHEPAEGLQVDRHPPQWLKPSEDDHEALLQAVYTQPPGGEEKIALKSVTKPIAQPQTPKSRLNRKELECLALNIYHEARSESRAGRLAVAAVTLNRARSSAYPNSICAVVRQGGERRHRCQFSWWCDGKSDRPTEQRAWRQALKLAESTLLGLEKDPTGGATHYHATYVRPHWAKAFTRTARIGQHLFYRSGATPPPEGPLQLAALDLPTIN